MCCKTQGPGAGGAPVSSRDCQKMALLLRVYRFTAVGTLSPDVGAEVVAYAATDNLTWRGSSSLSERKAMGS